MSEQAAGLLTGLAAAALFGLAAVAQAHAVRRVGPRPTQLTGFVLQSVRDPLTMLVVLAYLGGFVLHAVVIWLLPLYLAQTLVSLSLPVTALASRRVDDELGAGDWADADPPASSSPRRMGRNGCGSISAPTDAAITSATASACWAASPPCLIGKAVASPAAKTPSRPASRP